MLSHHFGWLGCALYAVVSGVSGDWADFGWAIVTAIWVANSHLREIALRGRG